MHQKLLCPSGASHARIPDDNKAKKVYANENVALVVRSIRSIAQSRSWYGGVVIGKDKDAPAV